MSTKIKTFYLAAVSLCFFPPSIVYPGRSLCWMFFYLCLRPIEKRVYVYCPFLSVYWHKLTSHCTSFPAFNPHQYPTVCIKVPIIPNHDATCIPLSHLFPTFCESVHAMMDGYASHYTLFKLTPSPLFCLFPIFFTSWCRVYAPPPHPWSHPSPSFYLSTDFVHIMM